MGDVPFKVRGPDGDTRWLHEDNLKLHRKAADAAPQEDAEATDPETETVAIAAEESKSETVSASAAQESHSPKYYNPLPNTSDQRRRTGASGDWVVVESEDSSATGEA